MSKWMISQRPPNQAHRKAACRQREIIPLRRASRPRKREFATIFVLACSIPLAEVDAIAAAATIVGAARNTVAPHNKAMVGIIAPRLAARCSSPTC
jgi:hypothetical protein